MQVLLTAEERALQERARRFADEEVAPAADANSRAARFPVDLVRRAAELGYLGVLVPREFGGSMAGNMAQVVILEEINRACASTGVAISVHNSLACNPIRHFGSPEVQRRYLPRMASGEWLGAYCLTEPHSGSDAAALRTTAVPSGDEWILNGTKFFITSGAEADVYVVFTRTGANKTRGITAFVVERTRPGVSVGKEEVKMGLSASHTVEIQFQDCRVPAANLLGELGGGFRIAMHTLDGGRIGIATQAVGIAQACLDASVRWAQSRRQFGQPIAEFQAIQNKLALIATDIEAARHLTYHAARLRDAGAPCTKEAAMAKLFASTMCNRAARDAVQIHGATGCMRGADVERYFRDARVTELYEGTTEIQKMVIARQVLKEHAAAVPETAAARSGGKG
jgi:alkylation response protein AidB-like acyl-CoA dehydrogenase